MVYDAVIVGAGPAGLTAGMYVRTKMMSTLIIDAGFVGGQLTSLYPEKSVRNFPCFESIKAKDLSDRLCKQAESVNCEIRENEIVEEIRGDGGEFFVKTSVGEYSARSVIIATGMGIFDPKKIGCEGEMNLNGKGLSYVMPSTEELVGKKVVIFGGGNSAIEMAMMANAITDTTIVHRRDEFRADERNVADLMNSSVKVITSAKLRSVNGSNCVESVTLDLGEKSAELPANIVVINIGTSSNLSNLKRWGLESTEKDLIKVKPDMSTSRQGIFACGDAVDYPGKCKKIIISCGEACTAALSAHRFVRKPYWS